MSDKLIDALKEIDAKATPTPWRVRFSSNVVSRRDDVDDVNICGARSTAHPHWCDLDATNAATIVSLRNALPAMIAFVEAADDLVAEYAHYLNERDGVQRELDPYDAARARLLAAITGEKE